MAPPSRPTAASLVPILRPLGAGDRQRRALEETNLDLVGFGPTDLLSLELLNGRSIDLVKKVLELALDAGLFIDTTEKKFARLKEKELAEAFEQMERTVKNFVTFARKKMSDDDEDDAKELFARIEKASTGYAAEIRAFITSVRRFVINPKKNAKAFRIQKIKTDAFVKEFVDDLSTLGKLSFKRRKR